MLARVFSLVRLLPIIAMSLFTSGLICTADPCDPDTDKARCEGNTIVSCPQPGPDQIVADHWVRRDCGEDEVCVVSENGVGLCALSEDPDPRCEGRESAACDDTTQVYCSEGFATGEQTCFSCVELDEDNVECQGGFGHNCSANTECVSGTCNDQGHCTVPNDG
jgi:hypothetical protein